MEVEKEEENPDIFLDKELLETEKKEDENTDISNSYLELNDITIKQNKLLLIGTYGNGSALLKTCFFLEMKNQRNCFKTKFQFQGKDKKNKKVLAAELYQIDIGNNENILILLTKSGFVGRNSNYIIKYFEDKNITYNSIISFDSITMNNFYAEKKIQGTYYLCNEAYKLSKGNANLFLQPNSIVGFSAYILRYADFKDIPCIVFVSVFPQFDIGFDSVKIYEDGLSGFDIFKGKLEKEYYAKNKIDFSDLKLVYNEFNSNKKSYFI
jgi:hypothetical protein